MEDTSYAWWRGLVNADWYVLRKAASEVLVIGGLSIFPLLLGAFGAYKLQPIIPNNETIPLLDFLWASIFRGQLYYYTMAFIAAIVWHSARDLEKPFPPRIIFWSIAFILGMVCAFFFGLEPALPSAENSDLSYISIIVYLISAIMYFIILVFRDIDPPDIGKEKRKGEASFLESYQKRRGVRP